MLAVDLTTPVRMLSCVLLTTPVKIDGADVVLTTIGGAVVVDAAVEVLAETIVEEMGCAPTRLARLANSA